MEQINPTLIDVGMFVVISVFVLGGVKQTLGIINYFKPDPPLHDQFVKTIQCKDLRTMIEQKQSELDDGLNDDRRGRSVIHHDVRRVEGRVAKVEGLLETYNQRQISQGSVLEKILSELGEVKGQLKQTSKE